MHSCQVIRGLDYGMTGELDFTVLSGCNYGL